MVKTVWSETLKRHLIICGGCTKPIKETSYSNGGLYLCEDCNFKGV